MNRTGLVYDERFLLHDTGLYHPECADRIRVIYKHLVETGIIEKLVVIGAEKANQRWIEQVHNIHYIMKFEESCMYGLTEFDHPDNAICRDTYETAFLAVGGVLKAVDRIMDGTIDNAFCAVRPPGHHAELDKPMGFCYFNNVAIAARYVQQEYGIERVAVIDFDVHHGNGTQHTFDSDPSVLYYSIHEHPSFAYPGTGREFETGTGKGKGFTVNSPVLPGRGDNDYCKLLTQDLVPAMKKFNPEFILISAGFDAHETDLMSGTMLTADGYDFISNLMMNLANRFTDGKVVSVLEGGYNLEVLPVLVENHIRTLAGLRR
ncbi:histone deacetylase family protein [Desulforhopalus singaporensis]|uniref:Acetoin utilization deacetylase AcuC n=1 Tax=Desulforhopalus singaporensis TaxID=91360 RepID=A0A1H0MKR8_9BACT|nr:histone deacetylase [Desulforhopalus singaporensis]SDO81053.1 Acetoin utilization deacetylase AcuC [Desulforhopalus singaporensis]